MFKNIQPGTVIYDLAAVQGGNTVFEVTKSLKKMELKFWDKQIF